jgi:hypothetical protein
MSDVLQAKAPFAPLISKPNWMQGWFGRSEGELKQHEIWIH